MFNGKIYDRAEDGDMDISRNSEMELLRSAGLHQDDLETGKSINFLEYLNN